MATRHKEHVRKRTVRAFHLHHIECRIVKSLFSAQTAIGPNDALPTAETEGCRFKSIHRFTNSLNNIGTNNLLHVAFIGVLIRFLPRIPSLRNGCEVGMRRVDQYCIGGNTRTAENIRLHLIDKGIVEARKIRPHDNRRLLSLFHRQSTCRQIILRFVLCHIKTPIHTNGKETIRCNGNLPKVDIVGQPVVITNLCPENMTCRGVSTPQELIRSQGKQTLLVTGHTYYGLSCANRHPRNLRTIHAPLEEFISACRGIEKFANRCQRSYLQKGRGEIFPCDCSNGRLGRKPPTCLIHCIEFSLHQG